MNTNFLFMNYFLIQFRSSTFLCLFSILPWSAWEISFEQLTFSSQSDQATQRQWWSSEPGGLYYQWLSEIRLCMAFLFNMQWIFFYLTINWRHGDICIEARSKDCLLKAYGYKIWYVEANNCRKRRESLVEPLQSQAQTLQNDNVFLSGNRMFV